MIYIYQFIIICNILLINNLVYGQSSDWQGMNNLIDKTWYAEGNWGDGSKFKQEITFTKDLEGSIIIARAKGYVDQEQTKYGNRNHGIRKFNPETGQCEFWEFDAFGGVTKGEVVFDGKDIIYQYKYGESVVTDMWQYKNDSTYTFTVGSYTDGQWNQKYLETEFSLVEK